jgi:pimeloyl-ACP methyl ester carboxylesterase
VEIEPGVRLFFDVHGCSHIPGEGRLDKRPTLLLLHGGPGSDHSVFKPVALPLAEHMQLVFYDHRGMGRSDRCSADQWNLDVWADDIVRFCDALSIADPFVLGASFGGMVAMRYLARHPGHAAKVVLMCTRQRSMSMRNFAFSIADEQQRRFALRLSRSGGRQRRRLARPSCPCPRRATRLLARQR